VGVNGDRPKLGLLLRRAGIGYEAPMTGPAFLRPLVASLGLGALVLGSVPAAAQGVPFSVGFASLPSFAWPGAAGDGPGRWEGSYASLSTGYEAVSSKRFGSYSGPTIGFEGGRLWQDGRLVYGISGGLDYLIPAGGTTMPGFGRLAYSRDFAGIVHAQVGTLLTPSVLLYGKVGALAVHETLRAGPTPVSPAFSRDDLAIRPDARVGVEWALTDRLSVAVEAGVVGNRIR